MRPLRVMRVIPRMNVGGPARQVGTLMRGLDPNLFQQRLYVGTRRSESGDVAGRGSADERDYRELRVPAVRAYALPAFGQLGVTGHARALAALVAEVRDFKPDVMHTHGTLAGRYGRIAAGIQGVPIRVHTFDSNLLFGELSPARTRVLVATERALARGTDKLIASGLRVRDEILAAGIGRSDQFEVMPPSINLGLVPDRDEARRILGLSRGGPVVAVVGQVTRVKRPDRMLDVARELRASIPELQFVVCGEGDQLAATVNRSATDRLRMSFPGWRADVETVYAAADLILLTSDHEGMPPCLIEAGLAGRAVVATDVGSVAEVVRHGETGLLADADVGSLTRCVERLLRDDNLRRRMGLAAFAEATRRFGSDRLVAETSELYRRLAVKRGRWPASVMRNVSLPLPTVPIPTLPSPARPRPAGPTPMAPSPTVPTPSRPTTAPPATASPATASPATASPATVPPAAAPPAATSAAANTEPTKTEPTKTEAANTEATMTEPTMTEATTTEATKTEVPKTPTTKTPTTKTPVTKAPVQGAPTESLVD